MKSTIVYPVRAFQDNYIWVIHDGRHAVAVDPGDAAPLNIFLTENSLELCAILITHHHADHTGGLRDLANHDSMPIYGPTQENINYVNRPVCEGDEVQLEELNIQLHVLEIPGHTAGHIAYHDEKRLFCGDTLFSAGCGRLFEGSPQQMHESLQKLNRLSPSTKVYCTHEYTQANIKFARAVEPDNEELRQYEQLVIEKRSIDEPTLPSTLDLEQKINPFLRTKSPSVISSANNFSKIDCDDDVAVFTAVRSWKDNFR